MNIIYEIFGQGKELSTMQMCCRALAIFLYALLLIRISGRRSFGIRTPLDNIIVILLGTILGRAIVGVSAVIPVVSSSLVIVVFHRILGWCIAHSKNISHLIEGNKLLLFENGKFLKNNLSKGLLCEEDVLQGVRKSALTEDLNQIQKIYIERNGEISAIKND
jgi:uncharacterized membrane protein YcaP (DUF421 family)